MHPLAQVKGEGILPAIDLKFTGQGDPGGPTKMGFLFPQLP